MASAVFFMISFLNLLFFQIESCSNTKLYYSASLNSSDLVPIFSSITCSSTYIYLTDGNFTLSTASIVDTNEVANLYLEINVLYCDTYTTINCYPIGTRPTILLTDSIVTFIVTSSLVIRNINLSHKFEFKSGCVICDYCRFINQTDGLYYNDRIELIYDDEYLEQDICNQYTTLNFISVLSTGNLLLENVSFTDFRMQFSSLIYIDQGQVTLLTVNFYNIVVSNSVILSQSQSEVFSTKFYYADGGIELLNNGYELHSIYGSNTFIKLTNYFEVYLQNLNIKNNIGNDKNYFIDLNNIYKIGLWQSNFTYNVLKSHLINIDQRKISSYESLDTSGYLHKIDINSIIFNHNYAEHLINFGYDLKFQRVIINSCHFNKNSVSVVIYYTSNFQDSSQPIDLFEYFYIQETNFEMNEMYYIVKLFSLPNLSFELIKIENNGLAIDVENEILGVIKNEANFYLQIPLTYFRRYADSLIYLSLSIYTAFFYCEFYNNYHRLIYIRLSSSVQIISNSFKNNYINNYEDYFIKIEDFYGLIISRLVCQNNTVSAEDSYFMNLHGQINTLAYIESSNFVDCNAGIYIALGGELYMEGILMKNYKTSGLPLLDIKIEKFCLLYLNNSEFTNNTNDIIHINPAFGAVPFQILIENTNFTDSEAKSKLISIGPKILVDSQIQNIVKNCKFSNNILNVITIESSGGEIYFENCVFDSNSASDTGVISGFTSTNLIFTETEFSHNGIILLNFNLNPNTIKTYDCVFKENLGIIIQVFISDYFDYGSIFSNNLGSILKIQSEGSASLDSTKIISNAISSENSLVEIVSGSNLIISNVTFYNNTSAKKSILFIENNSGAILSDSIFELNSAYRGSALFIQHCLDIKTNITNVKFLKNNAEVSGTIFILEGLVNIENCEFSTNKAFYSAGIDSIYSSIVIITNTKFNTQIGRGSCIKCQESSEITIFNSEFEEFYSDSFSILIEAKDCILKFENCKFKNVEFYEGYLILGENSYFLNRKIISTNSVLNNLKMQESSYLMFFEKVSQIEIDNITVQSFTGSAIYVKSMSLLNITNSVFQDGISENGAGVICESCKSLNIAHSEFKNLKAYKKGGCVYANSDQIEDNFYLYFCNFYECASTVGGALYILNSGTIITNSNFSSNQALKFQNVYNFHKNIGEGGAIFQDYSDNQPSLHISQSAFKNNFASVSGGAIQWYSLIPIFSNTSFIENNAYYGANIGSFPFNFNFSDSRVLTQIVSAPGQIMINPIKILIFDHYNQVVLTDNKTTAELSFLNDVAFIKGTTKVDAINGEIEFSDIIVYGEPGLNSSLIITAEPLLSNMPSLFLSIDFELRECISGEVLISNNTCEVCKSGTYNLIPATECLECPTVAKCKGGNEIYTKNGYWRINKDTDRIFICPNQLACLSDENEEKCETGYKGNLCQVCSEGYSRSAENTCSKCLDQNRNSLRISGIILCITLFLVFQTFSSINSAYKEQSITSIYLKILVNYLQLVGLTIAFELDWPELALEVFRIQGYASNGSEQFLSFDCFFAGIYEPYFIRLMIFSALPTICFLISLASWLLINCCKKIENLKEKIIGSILLQLFFFHPMLSKINFSCFNCRELFKDKYYLTSNMDIECWKGNHLMFSLAVAIPSILIYCVGLPFLFFLSLYKYRGSLDKISEKLKFNFLFKGYVDKFYYWESIIIMRKLLIIFIFVFLTHQTLLVQALCTFMVVLISFILQFKFSPYTHPSLNTLELQSITVSVVTIYSGLYFLSNSIDNTAKIIIFILMVLSNLLFISTWVYLTFSFFFKKLLSRFTFCRKICRKLCKKYDIKIGSIIVPDKNKPAFGLVPNSPENSRIEKNSWFEVDSS